MLYSLLIAFILVACEAKLVLHETRKTTPGWTKQKRIPEDTVLPVRIGLTQSNLDKGYELLQKVSDPDSEQYGKHYTQDQVIQLFQPSVETVSVVKNWLSQHVDPARITHSDNKGWFAFDATRVEVENLVQARFYIFQHVNTGSRTAACDLYHIPEHLVGHIDYITPGVRLLPPMRSAFARDFKETISTPTRIDRSAKTDPDSLKNCDLAITDACIRALYHIPLHPSLNDSSIQANNAIGVFEKLDTYGQENLNQYFKEYASWIPQGTHPKFQGIDGAAKPTRKTDFGESDLDFSLIYPIVYPQEVVLFQTDDPVYNREIYAGDGLFNTFLDAIDGSYCTYKAFGEKGDDPKIDPHYPHNVKHGYKGKLQCGVFKPTPVISVSYGSTEAFYPDFYQKRQCNEFMKLGLQGVSVLFASGDTGVSSFDVCLGKDSHVFSPLYPTTCPWVTSVGGTKIARGGTVSDPEIAANNANSSKRIFYRTGGGFSNVYPTPEYQRSVVHEYLEKYTPPYKSYTGGNYTGTSGVYNRNGRAVPDVSANSDFIVTFFRGKKTLTQGTSASAPIFASIISRINEERLAAGKSTLGFLNTALYKNPHLLNDITEGSNPGCGTLGFSAEPGWDPVTGLGTPNYPRMLKFFLNLS